MKSKLGLWLLASACWGLMSCSSSSTKVEEPEKEETEVVDFYKGADISWVTLLRHGYFRKDATPESDITEDCEERSDD